MPDRKRQAGASLYFRLGAKFLVGFLLLGPSRAHAQDNAIWAAIDPADLKLTENPKEPGGQAIVLDAWDDVDNPRSSETVRVRIKILREDGKKYADIEIPYVEKYMQIEDLHARTVLPDGQSVPFDGAVFERDILKAKKYKVHAKTLTLPNVQVGSIVEYVYRLHWKRGFPDVLQHPGQYLITEPIAYPAAEWEVQRDIYVRHTVLTLRPYPMASLQYAFVGFAKEPSVDRQVDGSLRIELRDLPAYSDEEASPPEGSLRQRVAVFYSYGFFQPQEFWRGMGRLDGQQYANFLKKAGLARNEAQRLISPADSSEAKLRKLYARAQQIRMVSFEESKTEKEKKREDLKENKNVDDVLSRNYAYANEINLVYVALAQAAGFSAYPVRVVSREGRLFQMRMYDPSQMNAMVVEVLVDGKSRYFDPATLYCPFDLVPWAETDTVGIRADASHPELVEIPSPNSTDAVIRRKAELKLDENGNLEGEVMVTFERQEALGWRLETRNQDETQRAKGLEDWLKDSLPANSQAKLTGSDGWGRSEGAVSATFHVQTQGFASRAGQRLLLPMNYLAHSGTDSLFAGSRRSHPLYFRYSAEKYDELHIVASDPLAVEAVPGEQVIDRGLAKFALKASRDGKGIRVTRSLILDGHYFPTQQFTALKSFYQAAGSAGEQQVVFKRNPPPSGTPQ